MDFFDLTAIVAAMFAALAGLRLGFLRGTMPVLGFVAGFTGAVAVQVALRRAQLIARPEAIAIALGVAALAGVAGTGLAAVVGERARISLRSRGQRSQGQRSQGQRSQGQRVLNAITGGISMIAVVLLLTGALVPLAHASSDPLVRQQAADSAVARFVDRLVPGLSSALGQPYATLIADGRRAQDAAGSVPARSQTPTETELPKAPSSPRLSPAKVTAAVRADAGSVVRVIGTAPECSLISEGTGFVVAHDRVLTNAHVVAGERVTAVEVGGVGPRLPATVVLMNPEIDLAVLDVPGLNAPTLRLATAPLADGSGGIVAGFPENGPYTLKPATVKHRVRGVGSIPGISGVHSRLVYVLHAVVRPGNSGGPMIAADGAVVAVVFARSSTQKSVGYALTAAQVDAAVRQAPRLRTAVSTLACGVA